MEISNSIMFKPQGGVGALVSYYNFNGNTNDSVGSFNLTNYGASLTTDKDGNTNSAYQFNNTEIDKMIYDGKIIDITEFSFTMWVNPVAGSQYPRILDIGDGINSFQILYDGELRTKNTTYQSGYLATTHTYANWYDGNWKFIEVCGNETTTDFYINGSLLSKSAYDFVGVISNGASLFLGTRKDNDTYISYNGKIDDVRIYNYKIK